MSSILTGCTWAAQCLFDFLCHTWEPFNSTVTCTRESEVRGYEKRNFQINISPSLSCRSTFLSPSSSHLSASPSPHFSFVQPCFQDIHSCFAERNLLRGFGGRQSATKEISSNPSLDPVLDCYMFCSPNTKKRPAIYVFLTDKQVQMRGTVDTSPLQNPFFGKQAGSFLLCTDCRSKKLGWSVISDTRRYGSRARTALQRWKSRVIRRTCRKNVCCICEKLLIQPSGQDRCHEFPVPGHVSVHLALFQVLLDTEGVRAGFCAEWSNRSGIGINDALEILRGIQDTRF